MNKEPLIYVVLVNYKGKEHTIECIDSLNKILYKNFKIIVVDNDSNDGCIEFIKKKYKNLICISSKTNLGFAGANNLAIRYAIKNSADFVLLLNNDTIVEKNFLNELLKPFTEQQFDNVGISIAKIKYYFDRELIWYAGGYISNIKANSQIIGLNEYDNNQFNIAKEVEFATGCCMLISKEVIKNVGYLDESYFLYYEDTDYSCKVIKKGYKIIYYPNSVIYHKESVSTNKFSYNYQYYFSRNRLIFIKNNMKLFNKFIGYPVALAWILKKIVIKEFQVKPCIKGIVDFCIKKRGKL